MMKTLIVSKLTDSRLPNNLMLNLWLILNKNTTTENLKLGDVM